MSFEVRRGELFGLLGPNGAGKTTLIRMLTTLIVPTSGQGFVAGFDVARDPGRVREAIGVIPQALTSDLDLTGWENVDIYGDFYDLSRRVRRERAQHLLHMVGLTERANDLVATYSGGMRRRLEIARGLIHSPEVLFLDEPTIGLDPQSRRAVWDLLEQLRTETELTISLTTHYMDEAETLCDRIAIVDGGKIIAIDTPAELKAMVKGADRIELEVEGDARKDRSRCCADSRASTMSRAILTGRLSFRSTTARTRCRRLSARSTMPAPESLRSSSNGCRSRTSSSASPDGVCATSRRARAASSARASGCRCRRGADGGSAMRKSWAIMRRDLLKISRNPLTIFTSVLLPIIYLVIFGNSFQGVLKHLPIVIVSQDNGP